jgi:hypothetical protein
MSTLNWKPFIMKSITTYADGQAAAQAPKPADAHVVHQHFVSPEFCATLAGSEATDEFTIADLEPEVSVIAGTTTSGYWAYGVVMGWNPGKYISFDGPNVGSLLWSEFLLLRGPIATIARERYRLRYGPRDDDEDSPSVPLQRTDSGTSYNFTGRPDHAFWVRSGIEPFLFVTSRHYHGRVKSQYALRLLEDELANVRAMTTAEEVYPRPFRPTELEMRAARHQLAVESAELERLRAELAGDGEA